MSGKEAFLAESVFTLQPKLKLFKKPTIAWHQLESGKKFEKLVEVIEGFISLSPPEPSPKISPHLLRKYAIIVAIMAVCAWVMWTNMQTCHKDENLISSLESKLEKLQQSLTSVDCISLEKKYKTLTQMANRGYDQCREDPKSCDEKEVQELLNKQFGAQAGLRDCELKQSKNEEILTEIEKIAQQLLDAKTLKCHFDPALILKYFH